MPGRPGAPARRPPVLSIASAAILLQMALMYLFSALYKTNADWIGGQVIAGTLAHDFYAKPTGEFALRFPALLTAMTWGVFLLEWAGPLLLFVPKHTARVRLVTVAALAVMHLGIELCVTVGLFSFISMVGLTLFLPTEFWNYRWLARFSSPVAQTQPILQTRGLQHARRPFPLWLRDAVSASLLAYVVWLNVEGWLGHAQGRPSSAGSKFLNMALGLGQKWSMFEDTPSKDGWYVARARLRDGSEVDLLQGGAPLTWSRPRFPAGMFANHRWRKCFREMAYFDGFGYQVFREPVARYLCKVWNVRQPADRQVAEFEFIYCAESRTGGPGTQPLKERLYPFAPHQIAR